jgi:two-component system nitrate/nitrite response regulator NarL
MTPQVRLVVADDHPLFRHAISDAIKTRPELRLLGAAAGGRDALELIRRHDPDVAVLDVIMPDLDGLAVLAATIRERLSARILFVAASTETSVVDECVARGASGYVDKGAGVREICDAVNAVARGQTVVSKRLDGGAFGQTRRNGNGAPPPSPRELQVLHMLADGLSAPQIARRLYLETSTIKTHLHHLYGKLHVSDRAAAVAEGMRSGLIH